MENRLTFADTAVALSLDYECVFFVDVENDNYAMHAFRGNHENIKLSDSNNFWADTRVNLQTVVYRDDRKRFEEALNKEKLIAAVEKDQVFNLKYRIIVEGEPVWYALKVVWGKSQERDYLIIGISNIDKQERKQLVLEQRASKSQTYGQIVMALAERYDALYMVDMETNHYTQYRSERIYSELKVALEGEDFFNQLQKDALQIVYREDILLVQEALKRDVLLSEISENGVFTLTYRMNSMRGPLYVCMVAVYSDQRHLVISVTNVDSQVRREIELKQKASKSETYGQIVMALAERYDALYMVDIQTNHYAQYKTERVFCELSIAVEGEDFFNQLQKDAVDVVYEEDVPLVQAALTRKVLLKELDAHGAFSLTYRLNSPGGPLYVSLVAVYADKNHIVISITNIDAQIRREQKIREEASAAFEKARRDDLTGIKNKTAYTEFEEKLDAQIKAKEAPEFAIAICDVNGLKTVNDTQGHKAGDEYIKDASNLVCETFKHSPVFRVGGDEFVAILTGVDFDNRETLTLRLDKIVRRNAEKNKVVVACGVAVYDRAHDKSVAAIFERADAMMYKNKMSLKGGRDEILNTIIRAVGARSSV